jgi:hypothetical protein
MCLSALQIAGERFLLAFAGVGLGAPVGSEAGGANSKRGRCEKKACLT